MKVLITGGAGFIGSSLAASFCDSGDEVRVLDDLTTGFEENIPRDAAFIRGSVEDRETVNSAVEGVEVVLHHAAARAVLRSVEDPIATDRINTLGTLNVLLAARDAGVRRVVVASSSSVYGGVAPLPTQEDAPLSPKSPYAVSKLASEHYARVFSELYGLETVALRYFNVYGPRQRPDSPYAAVIPLFAEALLAGRRPTVHGDGLQSRDFTYVDDVVRANRLAAEGPGAELAGRVFNIAKGHSTSLLEILDLMARFIGGQAKPVHSPARLGDIRDSRADIRLAQRVLGFSAHTGIEEGIPSYMEWYSNGESAGHVVST